MKDELNKFLNSHPPHIEPGFLKDKSNKKNKKHPKSQTTKKDKTKGNLTERSSPNDQHILSQFLNSFSNSQNLNTKALFRLYKNKHIENRYFHFDKVFDLDKGETNETFDLVFVDMYDVNSDSRFIFNDEMGVPRRWRSLEKFMRNLNANGTLFALIDACMGFTENGKIFLDLLKSQGFYCNIFLKVDNERYNSRNHRDPILLGFQQSKNDQLFVSEVDSWNFERVVSNFADRSGDNINNGKMVKRSNYISFERLKIENEITSYQTQNIGYEQYQMSEVSVSINRTDDRFDDLPNSVYIPRDNPSGLDVVNECIYHNPQDYIQIQLNPELVESEYLLLFFESELGQLVIGALSPNKYFPKISIGIIVESLIVVPSLQQQKAEIHTNRKFHELQKMIYELGNELRSNSRNADKILEMHSIFAGQLKLLNTEDKILALIRKGENKKIEFKQTYSKNIHTSKKDTIIEKSSLKTITAFLNTDGGTLLIGVDDNGSVTGVEEDSYESKDTYLLHFTNGIRSKIGPQFYPLINYDLFEVLGKLVLKVDCKHSEHPCYYDRDDFYVRQNPRTDKLNLSEVVAYIRERFKN
ncbi:MAG: hypothetical protein HOG05_00525 [Bacteroidetes bacterium]|jgi:hypothetical protein|nr:hypothetical protein [Bacteroidota bacterium]MBT3935240.1 hypothetical protein [Bacteroidota bacterium]MBT5528436.1 hypothetical protein [Cytophagia bacterium]